MLSIDLGNENLAWVFLFYGKERKEENIMEFGMVNVDEDDSLIIHRYKKLYEFFSDIDDMFPNIRTLIVEKQARFNYVCNNLLYAVCALAARFCCNIYLFLPIMKFTVIHQPYDTKKRGHKKISIENCKKFILEYFPDKVIEYNKYRTKDDIADIFNQAIIYGILNNYL
jgi:hypothetical protein